nr:magnesium transporter [Limimaricola litoreus]
MHAVDEAVRLGRMDRDEVSQRIASLPVDRRAAVFSRLTPRLQVDLAEAMTRDDLATLGAAMAPDDLADLAGLLGAEARAIFLADLDPELRACAERLIAHAAGTAGGIMTTDYAALEADATALETLDSLRRKAPEEAAMQRVLVLNEGRLVGAVPLRDVILAPDDARLGELMDAAPIHVGVGEDRETAARLVARYDLPVLPVVEDDGRLVGVITHDDAARALAAETTEDFQKTSTVLPISETIRDAGIGLLYRKRVVWLALLVFGNLFSGAGLAYFEEMILTYVSLVFFLPLLIDSSGNAGAQSATLMVRAMATGEVEISDWTRLLLRELAVAAGLGVTMALVVAPLGLWRGGGEVALVVAATMMVLVLLGSLVGMSLPFLLSRFKLDPATASGPLVTTISDGVGVLVYFTIATLVLG